MKWAAGDRASVFGNYADDYDRWRPSYPDRAVDWLLPEGAQRVADVGAGTGKLTQSLVRRGISTTAIEPDPAMLDVLRRRVPEAHARLAGADALPTDDGELDAVLVAQAWHWFPHELATAEIRRTLRPGGRLGLLWNTVAPEPGWSLAVAELDPDFDPAVVAAPDTAAPHIPGLPSTELESTTFRWNREVAPGELRACLATHSAYAVMNPDERERRLARAECLAKEEAQRTGTARILWPHATFCVRWQPN